MLTPSFRSLAIAALLAAAPLTAQSLQVNPGQLTAGGMAEVHYSNPKLANRTVIIQIDNGARRNKQTTSIEITLDANGSGTAAWSVPGTWDSANFNAPNVAEVNCPVVASS